MYTQHWGLKPIAAEGPCLCSLADANGGEDCGYSPQGPW